jgi:acyl carrier protein
MQTFINNFENAIDGIIPGSITATTEFQKLPQWDSLALLSLLAMVDGEYGVQIAGQAIQNCLTVADLAHLIPSIEK